MPSIHVLGKEFWGDGTLLYLDYGGGYMTLGSV